MKKLFNSKRTVLRLGSSKNFSSVIPIPTQICKAFNINPGDTLFVYMDDGKIIVSQQEIKKQEGTDSRSKELESIESVW